MILLVGLLVLIAGVVAIGAVGAGVFGERSRERRSGTLVALAIPVVAVLGLAVVGGAVVGFGGGDDDGGDGGKRAGTSATPVSPTTAVVGPSRLTSATTTIPGVVMPRAEGGRFALYLPIGGLRPGAVIRVRASGFESFERGRIEHCVTELGRLPACTNSFPVQFDEHGDADFQLAVSGDFAAGGCRAGQPACSLHLTGSNERRTATEQFVIGEEFVAGVVTVAPERGLAAGQAVDVAVSGFPPGAHATVVLCAPPGDYHPERCSDVSGAPTLVLDARGAGRTTVTLTPGAAHCGPRRPCGVVVVLGDGYVSAAPAVVAFSAGPGVDYKSDRMLTGIGVALLLVAAGIALAMRTDWTKPSEAATPALDAADLRTDQTLDDLFGADAELDARDPIPW